MGFALLLYRIDGDQHVESNRDGLNAFLKRRRMRMKIFPPTDSDRSSAILLNEDGSHVDIGGILDLHFSNVLEEEDKTMTAWLGHAHLTADECDFIFDLCVSAGFVIANPQEDPSDIVPRGNHTAERYWVPTSLPWRLRCVESWFSQKARSRVSPPSPQTAGS